MPEITEELFQNIIHKLVDDDQIDGTCPFSGDLAVEIIPTCMQELKHCEKCCRFVKEDLILLAKHYNIIN